MTTALSRLSGLILSRQRPMRVPSFHRHVSVMSPSLLAVRPSDLLHLHRRDNDKDERENSRRFSPRSSFASLALQQQRPQYHHHHAQRQVTRAYHATSSQPLVLYGTIILVTAAGYVIYRKSQGKPVAPDALIHAKREFQESGGQYSQAAFARRQAAKLQQQQQQQAITDEEKKSSSTNK